MRVKPRDGFVSGAPFGRRVAEGFAGDFNSTNAAVQALVADLAKVDVGGTDAGGLFGDGSGASGAGSKRGDPDGREFDESIADDVDHIECPGCGMKIPKGAA